MKRTLLLFLSALALAVTAQAQGIFVTGAVANAQTGEPIELATVQLLKGDSTATATAYTNLRGGFSLKAPAPGQYKLRVSYVGFKPATQNVALGKDSLKLDTIKLSSTDMSLRSAVVTGTAARVEQKDDTTMYNASAYRVPEGSTLEALVKQLPGVEVSDEGKITVNGKEVKEVLVNGKDFFKGETDVAMKNLPVELVNRIKAYDKQSEYTEQTGIDDGEESTVLDIMTKRQLNESWVSNIDLGYGTKDRYSNRVFATRFTDNSRITVFGAANNVGDQGFGGPRGFRGGSGLTATKNAGADFSWENGKKAREAGRLELGGNVRYNHRSNDLTSSSASETFLNAGSSSSFNNSRSKSLSSSTNVNGSFRLQWNPDSMTNINFRPSFTHSDSHNSGSTYAGTFNDDPYAIEGIYDPLDSIFASTLADNINPALKAIAVNRNSQLSLGDSKSNSVNGALNVIRRFGSMGRNLSLRLSGGYSQSESTSFSISNIEYFNGNNPRFLNQYSNTPSKNWNYNVRIGYAEPITKNLFAEVRYEYGYKYTDSNRSRYNLDSLAYGKYADRWPEYAAYGDPLAYPGIGSLPTEDEVLTAVRDLNNSQYATYKYYDHTVTVGLRYNTDKVRLNAGIGFNPEKTKMEYERPGLNIDTLITRKVFNVSPQVRFRYRFSKTNNLDIRYQGSSSQPSMTNLLAVVDNSDPLNISMGNPGLKPSWTNSLRAFYRGYNADRQQGMAGGINFSQTRNSISNLMVYDESTGVRYTRPENISGNWNASGHFMFNTGIGAQKNFTVSTFSNLNYTNAVGYVSSFNNSSGTAAAPVVRVTAQKSYDEIFRNANPQKSTARTLGVGEHLNASYRTSWFDVGLLGTLNYQHSRSTLQKNANMDTWNFAYGANANLHFNWGMSLSTDIRMNSRRGYADNSMNTNELIWNAQLSQSFLKGRAATISIQFYDILHEQSNVSRTINAMMRSDSWTNAINSYCMVHFIYKLNIFNGTKKGFNNGPGEGERRMGPPDGGGRMGGGMPPMGGGRPR